MDEATAAFVDRRGVDWEALIARLSSDRDRTLVGNLRLLESVRSPTLPPDADDGSDDRPLWPLRLIIAVSWFDALIALIAAAVVRLSAAPPDGRGAELLLMLAFSSASVVLAAASRDRRRFGLVAGFAAAGAAFGRFAFDSLSTPVSWSLTFIAQGIVPEAFAAACFWRFVGAFPRVRSFTRFDRVAHIATGAAWILGGCLFTANVLLASGLVDHPVLWTLSRRGPDSRFWHLTGLALAPAILVLLVRARLAPSHEQRKIRRFAAAIGAGALPFLLMATLRSLVPSFDAWHIEASGPLKRVVDVIILTGLASSPAMTTAVFVMDGPLGRPRLSILRASLVSNRFVPALLLGAALVVLSSGVGSALPFAAMLALAVVAAVSCLLLAAGTSSMLFLRSDPSRQLATALARLACCRGIRELDTALGQAAREGLGAKGVLLTTGSLFGDERLDRRLPKGALVAMLQETPAPLALSRDDDLRNVLPRGDRAWLESARLEVFAPVRQRDGRLIAALGCERKWLGRRYTRQDLWFVSALAAAAAAHVERNTAAVDRLSGRARATDAEPAFECRACGAVGGTRDCGCGTTRSLAALPGRLGKFKIERRLGSGGMGVVYLARDTKLNRYVALKTLVRLGPAAAATLRREARAMARLRHPSLATIYGLDEWQATPVIIMEYFPRGTLAAAIRHRELGPTSVASIGVALCDALDFMHEHGVVHRDLKPSNIAIGSSGQPVLLDFGLAFLVSPGQTSRSSTAAGQPIGGTRRYLPPESHDAPAAPSVDLWSLGVVLLEAATPPHARGNHSTRDPRRAASLDLLCERNLALGEILRTALSTDPARRYSSARHMRTALHSALTRIETEPARRR